MKYLKLYEEIDFDDMDWEEEDPDYQEIDMSFYKFLNKNNCLLRFIKNFNPSFQYNSTLTIDGYFKKCQKNLFIFNAFPWGQSLEGYDYWIDLDRKWRHKVEIFQDTQEQTGITLKESISVDFDDFDWEEEDPSEIIGNELEPITLILLPFDRWLEVRNEYVWKNSEKLTSTHPNENKFYKGYYLLQINDKKKISFWGDSSLDDIKKLYNDGNRIGTINNIITL